MTNWSARAYSRTMSACQPMNSVVCWAWKRAPGQVVLRLALPSGVHRSAQVREPVRPVDQAPRWLRVSTSPYWWRRWSTNRWKTPWLWNSSMPGLVVDLEADDRRVVGVPADDLADHPLGVEPERRVGEVDLLPRAPRRCAAPVARLAGDLRVLPGEPRRHGVGRGAEDDGDAACVAPSRTGWSQSRSNRPFSGSQVDQTDSPTRITEKWASTIRSRSVSSRSDGWYSW